MDLKTKMEVGAGAADNPYKFSHKRRQCPCQGEEMKGDNGSEGTDTAEHTSESM